MPQSHIDPCLKIRGLDTDPSGHLGLGDLGHHGELSLWDITLCPRVFDPRGLGPNGDRE